MRILLTLCAICVSGAATAAGFDRYNTELPEYGLNEGPDGVYLTRQKGRWGESGGEQLWRYDETGVAHKPAFARHDKNESDFWFNANSNTAYFISDRAGDNDDSDGDIWRVHWRQDQWLEPTRLPAPVKSKANEYSPVIGPDGALYFASVREGGAGQGDIYRAEETDAGEWRVEALGANINSEHGEWNLGFTPDGERLIFEASGRPGNISVPGDLYLSRRVGNGWSDAVPLSRLNTRGSELMPRSMADGSMVFARSNEGDADLVRAHDDDFDTLPPTLAAVARSAGEVVLIDPATLKVRKRIAVGKGPHDIASSEDGHMAVVPLYGIFPKPHDEPIAPSALKWTLEPSAGFAVVDLITSDVKTFPLNDCPRPHGAATTAQANRAWITCEEAGEIREVDPRSGTTLRAFKTAKGVHKVMLLPGATMLAASNTDTGEAYLIDLKDGAVTSLKTGKGAEALAASSDGSTLYVANSFDKTVCAIDVETLQVTNCHPSGGTFPIALAADEAAGNLWVLRNASSDLAAMSLETGEITDVITLPSRPLGLALNAGDRSLYVTLPRRNEVLRINADTGEIENTSTVVMEGDDLDLIPAVAFDAPPDT